MTYQATTRLESEPTRARAIPLSRRSIRAQLAATNRAVNGADQAAVHEALESVVWDRRGLFQRLTTSN